MKQHAFIVPTAVATFLVAGCQSSTTFSGGAQITSLPAVANLSVVNTAVFPADRTATLWVMGLACPFCVHNIDRQLAGMKGVERVHVDLPSGEVRVVLVAKHPVTREQLVKVIDDSGFTLDRIEMPR